MRVIFINHPEDGAFDASHNEDTVEYKNNLAKCQLIGSFLKENNFNLSNIFTSNDLNSIRTADTVSKAFESSDFKKEMVVELRDYNQNANTDAENEKYIKDKFSKSFVFSELNQKELYENLKNSEDQVEWWKINVIDNAEKDFVERVKRIIVKFKENAQNQENDACIAIVTGKNFMSQLFAYITNTENYLQNQNMTTNSFSVSSFIFEKTKEVKIEFINFLPLLRQNK